MCVYKRQDKLKNKNWIRGQWIRITILSYTVTVVTAAQYDQYSRLKSYYHSDNDGDMIKGGRSDHS